MLLRTAIARALTVATLTTAPAVALAVAVSSPAPAAAQTLTLVAPAAPGGGWDQTARAMQRALREVDPRAAVQVENVPGAAGTIGLARFVSAERGRPDALLVIGLVMVGGIATNGSAVSLADVTPIARLTGEHEVIVVPADSPFHSLQDLIDALKRAPQRVSWGGGSAGGTDDLLARLLAEAVGVAPGAVNYVAFSGGGEALAAVLGGQVTAGISGYGEFAQSIAAGQLRALASSAPTREPGIDVPTLRELGVPLDLANWRGVVAPPGISAVEQAALTARVRALVGSAAWRDTLQRSGWTDLYADGPAFKQFLLAEQARVTGVIARLQAGGDAARGTDARGITARRFTPSPRTAPTAAIIVTVALAALLVWQRRGQGSTASTGGEGRVVAIAAACIAQAVLMPLVGFVPTAAVVFATGASALGSARPLRNLAIGLAVAVTLAVVFGAGLDVVLPMGAWAR